MTFFHIDSKLKLFGENISLQEISQSNLVFHSQETCESPEIVRKENLCKNLHELLDSRTKSDINQVIESNNPQEFHNYVQSQLGSIESNITYYDLRIMRKKNN